MNEKRNALKLFVGTAAVLNMSFREAPPSAPPPQSGGKGERRGIFVSDWPHRLLRQRFLAALGMTLAKLRIAVWIGIVLMLIAACSGTAPQQPVTLIEATPTGAPTASSPEVVQPTAQVEANPPTEAPTKVVRPTPLAATVTPEPSLPVDDQALNPDPPSTPLRLIFIHHSTGENWLADDSGLGLALRDNNYFVSDTNYGWGPAYQDGGGGTIGDHTDIMDWYSWFTGPHRDTYLAALYPESDQHAGYSRLPTNPGGPNTIIMFKSCFPNSNIYGNPADPPATSADNTFDLTVANAKRIYLDALNYFAAHQDRLFVVITAPPLMAGDTTPELAANARAFNNWLVNDWLANYPHANVAVFDFYTVLTTNGGDPDTNDLGAATSNHHRYRNSVIEHIVDQGGNTSAYPTGDSHPSQAGNLKATGEFVPLLNIAVHCWLGEGGCVR